MPRRTQEERIADRIAAKEAAGISLNNRQLNVVASNSGGGNSGGGGGGNSGGGNSGGGGGGSVAENRAAAQAANQSMQEYKAANNITPRHTQEDRQSGATQTNGNIGNYDPNSVGAQNEKYSHNDIKALKAQGYSVNEIGARINELGDGANLGAAAQRLRDKYVTGLTNPTPAPTPTPTPSPYPTPGPSPYPTPNPGGGGGGGGGGGTGGGTNVDVDNTQVQEINQDNDQTSTIIGDNNTVTQDQDNSIDQLGGNNSTTVNGGTAGSGEQAQSLFKSYVDSLGSVDVDIDNTQSQDVTQDNDQTSTITGDNNKVWQNQDNSIRQYGGDNRSFVYNGSGGYMDTPVSAATMGGFYDVDDSPAAQARFVDQHTTMNRDNQKRYAGMGMKTAGMFSGFNAASFDPAKLQTAIDESTIRSYDQATIKDNDVFGDRGLYRGLLSDYNFGKSPKEVEYDDDDDD